MVSAEDIKKLAGDADGSGQNALAICLYTMAAVMYDNGGKGMPELASLCAAFAENMRRSIELEKAVIKLFGDDKTYQIGTD